MNDFGNTWSTAEETVLREGYGRVHAEELGKKLGRSVQAVMHRANRIGLQSRRRWTPSDDQELRALCKAETFRAKWERELARLVRLSERRLVAGVRKGVVQLDLAEADAAFAAVP